MKEKEKIILSLIGTIGIPLLGWGFTKIIEGGNDETNLSKNKCTSDKQISTEKEIVYPEETKEFHKLIDKAEMNCKDGNYRYALFDARLVFENALKLYLDKNQCEANEDKIVKYLIACEQNDLIDERLINNLHTARRTCNYNSHEMECKITVTPGKTYYAIRQIKELLKVIDEYLSLNNKEVLASA